MKYQWVQLFRTTGQKNNNPPKNVNMNNEYLVNWDIPRTYYSYYLLNITRLQRRICVIVGHIQTFILLFWPFCFIMFLFNGKCFLPFITSRAEYLTVMHTTRTQFSLYVFFIDIRVILLSNKSHFYSKQFKFLFLISMCQKMFTNKTFTFIADIH